MWRIGRVWTILERMQPARAAHGAISTLLMLAILGHAAAALWHQFVRGDGLMGRMWFGPR